MNPLQKLPKNVGDWANLLLPKALKSCPKHKKSPNLVKMTSIHILQSSLENGDGGIVSFTSPNVPISYKFGNSEDPGIQKVSKLNILGQ